MQVPGGAVFASRTPRWTLAVVARRAALSSLMLWDLRAVLGELEGGPPIRRSTSTDDGAAGGAGRRARSGGRRVAVAELGAAGTQLKESARAPISIAGGLVDSVAAPVRRMQRDREPRALAYDPTGYARLIQPRPRPRRILEIAEEAVRATSRDVTLVAPELAAAVLERALARGGDLAELYAEARHGFALSLDDGRVERPQGGRERGVCVRVVQGESSYYGYVDGTAEEDLLRVADSVAQAVRGEARRAGRAGRRRAA